MTTPTDPERLSSLCGHLRRMSDAESEAIDADRLLRAADIIETLAAECDALRAGTGQLQSRLAGPGPPGMTGWQNMDSAPRDGTRILAVASGAGRDCAHLRGRMFVIHHLGRDWAVFPGMGAGDEFFSCWTSLDGLPPVPEALQEEEDDREKSGQ